VDSVLTLYVRATHIVPLDRYVAVSLRIAKHPLHVTDRANGLTHRTQIGNIVVDRANTHPPGAPLVLALLVDYFTACAPHYCTGTRSAL